MNDEVVSLQVKIAAELSRIEEDTVHSSKSHFNCADRWERINLWIGIPAVVLSAVTGYVATQGYAEIAAAIAAIVAVLAALQTFLKPSDRSVRNKSAGNQLQAVNNEARIVRTILIGKDGDEGSMREKCRELSDRQNLINSLAPPFSGRDFKKAKAGILKGEATHRVDEKASSK
jgi:hypothetical protein